VKDVLLRIKDAEAQAEQIVQAAKSNVAKRLEQAEVEAEHMVEQALSQARYKAELLMEQGTAAAAAKAQDIALNSAEQCAELSQLAKLRLSTAVKLIRERVMTRDGSS